MPVYLVIRKSDGVRVHAYTADAPIEWSGMEFTTHDHTEYVEPVINQDGSIEGAITGRTMTKLEYLRRFTQEERVAIREAAKTNPILEDYMALLELATEIDTSDPDTIAAVNMLEQAGLIGAGRAGAILNG